MAELERRSFPVSEIRIQRSQGNPLIVGYAAVFDSLSENLGGFREKIARGAFKNSLKRGDDVRALFNHNPDYVLGRTLSNTLRLQEDRKGLRIEIDPPDTSFSKDLITSINRGDIDQMSFGFLTKSDDWETTHEGDNIRTLNEVDLIDVSPVTFPAYHDTQIAVRGLKKFIGKGRVSDLVKHKLTLKQKQLEIEDNAKPFCFR